MGALAAVLYREWKIRATNASYIFWDIFYPLCNLLVFGVGINYALAPPLPVPGMNYNSFFLGGVLGMAAFVIASNSSWSFFMDRDNGIFYEMLTYPMSRAQFLLGKMAFNIIVGLVQGAVTIGLGSLLLHIRVRWDLWPLMMVGIVVGTAGWFFLYTIFALRIRRNDIFNSVTSVFYLVFLFVSSMFYPIDPLPPAFRWIALGNPITWLVDFLRYSTIGLENARMIAWEGLAFTLFSGICFLLAVQSLQDQK